MLRRRREAKKLLRVARMLRELDSASSGGRPRRRRTERLALNRV